MNTPADAVTFNRNLHGLRGLLALCVVVGHSGVADIATVSVWFFFVLSGYLLARIYANGMRPNQIGTYAVRRAARLVPLYALVLVIIAILPAGFYAATLSSHAAPQLNAIAATLLEHLTFRQANIHFWTLAQEMAGYALIAAVMLLRRRLSVGAFVGFCLALAVVFDRLIGPDVLPMRTDGEPRAFHGALFIIGVVAAMVPQAAPKPWASAAALALLGAVLAAGLFGNFISAAFHVDHWHYLIPTWGWGVIGAAVVLGLAHGTDRLDRLAFFGTISYGIYVFHYLAVLVIDHRLIPVQMVVVVAAISIPLAWLSWRYIEAPCIAFAHRITRRARPVVPVAGN